MPFVKSALGVVTSALLLLLPSIALAQSPESSAGSSAVVKITLQPIPFDPRPRQLESFLERYHSPLSSQAQNFIDVADRYELDWRLLPAIAGVESTFGKRLPFASFNPFGWGIYGDRVLRFPSYKDAMEAVARGLKERYPAPALTNFQLLGRIYNGVTPSSWSSKVNYFVHLLDNHTPRLLTTDLDFSL